MQLYNTQQWIQVNKETNKVIGYVRGRPKVYLDDGEMTPVDDQWIIDNDSIYPVYQDANLDPHNSVERPKSEWLVEPDKVIRTYYTIKNPEFNPASQRLVRLDYDQYIVTGSEVQTAVVEDVPVEEIKQNLLELTASTRYEKEVGGHTDSNGNRIKTDRESQSTMTSILMSITLGLVDTSENIHWKCVGGFARYTTEEFAAVAQEVKAFVYGLFLVEENLASLINGTSDVTALEGIYTQIITDTTWEV